MKLYAFDAIDEDLALLPLAARRALDRTGYKLSLEAWQALGIAERRALVDAGTPARVDVEAVSRIVAAALPPATSIAPEPEVPDANVPPPVAEALGPDRRVAPSTWAGLSALDRYALAKVADRGRPERIAAAWSEIVGDSASSPHLGPRGGARMIDVGEKAPARRCAVADTAVSMNDEAWSRLVRSDAPKGDVLATARIAGIMAAKKTSEIVPLCHPVALTHVAVDLACEEATRTVRIVVTAEARDRTGVEMEAMVGASAAALTVYDMLKAFDRAMRIGPTALVSKAGGRSGDYTR